jgi:hypothetical protein
VGRIPVPETQLTLLIREPVDTGAGIARNTGTDTTLVPNQRS